MPGSESYPLANRIRREDIASDQRKHFHHKYNALITHAEDLPWFIIQPFPFFFF